MHNMIVLNLTCGNSHRFEGWFASNEEYLRQSARQLVSCPYCSDMTISKLPTAPHVRRTGADEVVQMAYKDIPDAARLVTAIDELMRNSENVGENFPEEARKIHYKEVPARNILGIASAEETRSLLDEGISLISLPNFLRKDLN